LVKVKGVTDQARIQLSHLWDRYQERLADDAQETSLDEEEQEMLNQFGHTEKLAEPLPDPRRDSYLLMDFLPPSVLAAITTRLRKADTVGAATILAELDRDELSRWFEEERLPLWEKEKARAARDADQFPPADGDPFTKDWS
jgi:hypothetical protein